MIRARGLTKRFGGHDVLAGIDLDVARGERLAVLGLNGAGKTTLFRCLLGLSRFDGSLAVGPWDVRRQGSRARAMIGYVPQRAPLFRGTVREAVAFYCRLREADHVRVHRYLDAVGMPLDAHGDKPFRALSGGMHQKILLALALGAHVSALLLDEPTANLDPAARREFLRLLGEIPGDTAVLLSSHRLADVEAVASRVIVLHQGGIAYDGRIADLKRELSTQVSLWVKVPESHHEAARAHLAQSRYVVGPAGINGAVGVHVQRAHAADVIHELRGVDVAVDDFWIEAPTLERQLEALLGTKEDPT